MKQSAGKEKAAAGPNRAAPLPPPTVTRALFSPSLFVNEEGIARAHSVLAAEFLGGDQLKIRPDAGPQREGEVVTFHDFSVMGLLPPFSDFFIAVLEAFGLHMLHLHPNAVLILATFAYTCEAFVGVMPSVALFRHYFMPRTGRSRWIAGGVSFCLKKESAHQYPGAKIRANWGEWRHNWYFILAATPALIFWCQLPRPRAWPTPRM